MLNIKKTKVTLDSILPWIHSWVWRDEGDKQFCFSGLKTDKMNHKFLERQAVPNLDKIIKGEDISIKDIMKIKRELLLFF